MFSLGFITKRTCNWDPVIRPSYRPPCNSNDLQGLDATGAASAGAAGAASTGAASAGAVNRANPEVANPGPANPANPRVKSRGQILKIGACAALLKDMCFQ